jgi:hypothetical protein
MLQIAVIRENKEKVIAALAKKNMDAKAIVEEIVQLDENRRAAQVELDNTLSESNTLSKDIGEMMKNGEKAKAEILKQKTVLLRDQGKAISEKIEILAADLLQKMYLLPNLPADIVPVGKTPEENLNVFEEGEVPKLHEGALPHWELVKKYDIIDFELGVKITGAGFPVYKGKGAKLQRALITYFLDKNTDAGYLEYQVPHLVNEASAYGTGQLPDKEGQMYHATEDDFYLRLVAMGNVEADPVVIEQQIQTDILLKAKKNILQLTNEESKAETVIKMLNNDERFQMNKFFPKIKKLYSDSFGLNNKDIDADEMTQFIQNQLVSGQSLVSPPEDDEKDSISYKIRSWRAKKVGFLIDALNDDNEFLNLTRGTVKDMIDDLDSKNIYEVPEFLAIYNNVNKMDPSRIPDPVAKVGMKGLCIQNQVLPQTVIFGK